MFSSSFQLDTGQDDRGFTQLEVKITIAVVGVLSAIAIPSFLGWYEAQQLDNALTQVQSALKESQRKAIARSQNCTVSIPSGSEPTITGTCLASDHTLKTVVLTHNSANMPWTITFDFKGRNRNPGDNGTLVLTVPNNPNRAKCLVISTGIGLSRTGQYIGDVMAPTPADCTTS